MRISAFLRSRINFSWRIAKAVFSSLLVTLEPSSKALKVGAVSSVPFDFFFYKCLKFFQFLIGIAYSDIFFHNKIGVRVRELGDGIYSNS